MIARYPRSDCTGSYKAVLYLTLILTCVLKGNMAVVPVCRAAQCTSRAVSGEQLLAFRAPSFDVSHYLVLSDGTTMRS